MKTLREIFQRLRKLRERERDRASGFVVDVETFIESEDISVASSSAASSLLGSETTEQKIPRPGTRPTENQIANKEADK